MTSRHRGHARTIVPAFVAALVLGFATAHVASGAREDFLQNPDFVKGAGNSPDHWRTEGWNQEPATTTYRWVAPAGGNPGEVQIDSTRKNDARWQQTLSLSGGWYYMSVEARTENVGPNQQGTTISILEDGISSRDLRGTTNWTKIGLYLKVGPRGADLELGLRLGGYGSLNTGRAFFRDASAVRVSGPPSGEAHVYDLDAIRKASQPPPAGQPWTLVATFILLGAIAALGWRMYGDATMRSARATPATKQPKPAERAVPGKSRENRAAARRAKRRR